MMQPRYVVQKSPGIDGPPIAEGEPCIVVRGQDLLALEVIDNYIEVYRMIVGYDEQVVTELLDHRQRIVEWQATHQTKIADR